MRNGGKKLLVTLVADQPQDDVVSGLFKIGKNGGIKVIGRKCAGIGRKNVLDNILRGNSIQIAVIVGQKVNGRTEICARRGNDKSVLVHAIVLGDRAELHRSAGI